ncbi:MAG: histidinol-phosphate aminotransferase family protein [Chloroflexi bacterium]|nr:histidinol-phosphate aminotransferase family protein [Chloroflexota bacterium]
MTIRPRPEIESLRVSPHGGFHADEWRALGNVIDFSSNVNPFGVSPRVRAALQTAIIERHPDPAATELRDALATRLQLPRDQIIVGNGSLELIRAVAIAYVRASDVALIVGPTFGEYRVAVQVMGARVEDFRARAENDFQLDVDALAARIAELKPCLAFICNPNNPTGVFSAHEQIAQLVDASPETLWVVDEAFIAFAPRPEGFASRKPFGSGNVVIMRSMTKDYAIPGLRLGYALADRDVIAALAKVRAPWSVNALAQAAGLAVLSDDAFLRDTLAKIRAASRELHDAITRLGWRVIPSAVHFFLVEVGDARAFRAMLAQRGCIVRDCASFGLPEFVRVATRTPVENARLIAALEDLRYDSAFSRSTR